MEFIYIAIVVVLFMLAISDLIVGVSNDAVNFLNSAIGSKAANFKVIMIIASVGILVGTTFSSGMMEVARKGIFNPEHFYFSEIMILFLAVMLTDILLLDFFNTHGLPTSTTVSIVFELLGASVALAFVKIYQTDESFVEISKYINTGSATLIIVGIFLSVLIAFSVGAIIQYISRIIFSFNFERSIKYFGGIFGGIAITGITYFILIKGAKGSSLIDKETLAWIKTHTFEIIIYGFVGWTVLLQLLNWLFKVNILKVIVLVGTFALAMAFAGNDLVNFIGVPLAGFKSYDAFAKSGAESAGAYPMDILTESVKTETYLLLIAGAIMTVTLWMSKKAKRVVKTSIDLSRQDEGEERFSSSGVARSILRMSKSISSAISVIVPQSVSKAINRRFEMPAKKEKEKDGAAFDLIRASVILTVSSMLIAFGTSLKLPLSTTYVTFMVAMGTSLSDRAWGRESAVYRITGVLTVIGGWFLTAISAFIVASIFAVIISYGGTIAIILLIALAIFVLLRTHLSSKKKKEANDRQKAMEVDEDIETSALVDKCLHNFTFILKDVGEIYKDSIDGLTQEKRKKLKRVVKRVDEHEKQTQYLKVNVSNTINKLKDDSVDTDFFYMQLVDYMREVTHCVRYVSIPSFNHIDNNHKGMNEVQASELLDLSSDMVKLLNLVSEAIKDNQIDQFEGIHVYQESVTDKIDLYKKNQIQRIKRKEVGTKNSLLFLNILNESKNLALHGEHIYKAFRRFVRGA